MIYDDCIIYTNKYKYIEKLFIKEFRILLVILFFKKIVYI